MNYIYRGTPQSMHGNKLIPLNAMGHEMDKIRSEHTAKYKGRETIMQQKIPLLNCLWNDVVQFLPLHPQTVFELQKQLKLIPSVPKYKFFEIDIKSLDPGKTVVFFKTAPGEENVTVKWLNDVDIGSLQKIPAATRSYYESLIGSGGLPFNYQFIPHILYKGEVDISKCNIITL
jgi:hypothetical protein